MATKRKNVKKIIKKESEILKLRKEVEELREAIKLTQKHVFGDYENILKTESNINDNPYGLFSFSEPVLLTEKIDALADKLNIDFVKRIREERIFTITKRTSFMHYLKFWE